MSRLRQSSTGSAISRDWLCDGSRVRIFTLIPHRDMVMVMIHNPLSIFNCRIFISLPDIRSIAAVARPTAFVNSPLSAAAVCPDHLGLRHVGVCNSLTSTLCLPTR